MLLSSPDPSQPDYFRVQVRAISNESAASLKNSSMCAARPKSRISLLLRDRAEGGEATLCG